MNGSRGQSVTKMPILFSLVKEILRIFSFINMYLLEEEVFDREASFFSADKVIVQFCGWNLN